MADLRRCIGSTEYRIEAHEAPVTDFPAQPSQKRESMWIGPARRHAFSVRSDDSGF